MLLLLAVVLAGVSLFLGPHWLAVAQTPSVTPSGTATAVFVTEVAPLDPTDLVAEDLVFHGAAYRVGATADGEPVEAGTEFPPGVDPVTLDLAFDEDLPGTIPSSDLLDVYFFDGTSWAPLGLSPEAATFHASAGKVGDYAVAAPALRVAVAPSAVSLRRGETVQFAATVVDPDDEEVEGYEIEWLATSAAGTISTGGLFRATGAPGDYPGAVVASLGDIEGYADIRIDPYEVSLPLVVRNWEMQVRPNDPQFSTQWNLRRIRAPQAWAITTGGPVVVAIIDSGADLDHPDLQANLVPGFDFVNRDNVPDDDNGHGTHVAGIVGAVGNNGRGVTGTSWSTRVMPLKVLKADGAGSISDAAAAVYWAVDNGARVINLSLGLAYRERYAESLVPLEKAISYAVGQGVVVAAAVGNVDHTNILMGDIVYPAAYPGVVGVGSTDSADRIASTSNQGPLVDAVAPGQSVLSTWAGGIYWSASGTSMATPHVAGLAALIWSRYPHLTGSQVTDLIAASARDLGAPGYDTTFGHGLIDAGTALIKGPALLASGEALTAAPQSEPPPAEAGMESAQAESGWYRPGVLLVEAEPEALARAQQSLPEAVIQAMETDIGVPGLARLHVPEGTEAEMLEQISQLPGVRGVYFDAYVYAMD